MRRRKSTGAPRARTRRARGCRRCRRRATRWSSTRRRCSARSCARRSARRCARRPPRRRDLRRPRRESEATEAALRAGSRAWRRSRGERARDGARAAPRRAGGARRRGGASRVRRAGARCAASEGALRKSVLVGDGARRGGGGGQAAPPPAAAPTRSPKARPPRRWRRQWRQRRRRAHRRRQAAPRRLWRCLRTRRRPRCLLVPRDGGALVEAQLAMQLSVPGRGHPNVAKIAEIGNEVRTVGRRSTRGTRASRVQDALVPLRHLSAAEVHDGLRGVWLPLGLGLAYIDLKAENVRLAEATAECCAARSTSIASLAPPTAARSAPAALVNARGTAGWRAPDVVDLLLRDDASAVLTKDEADEVLARQVTWGAGLIRLRLEAAERSRPAPSGHRTFALSEDPPVPRLRPTALVPTARCASWLDGLPPLYRTARGVADHIARTPLRGHLAARRRRRAPAARRQRGGGAARRRHRR